MKNWIDINKNESHIKREKNKAINIRKKTWWQTKISQGICYYCQNKFSKSEFTMDHKIPLSRGGRSIKGNIVPCCKKCNNNKKYYTPVEKILENLDNN